MVENLPVPLDRRVWQEACALRDNGYEVVVICPKMRGFVRSPTRTNAARVVRSLSKTVVPQTTHARIVAGGLAKHRPLATGWS